MNTHLHPRYCFWSVGAAGLVWLASLAPVAAQTADASEAPHVVGRRQAIHLLVREVSPDYPPLARVNYIQGQVSIEMLVSDEGQVARAHVLRGNPLLAAEALRAVRGWLYHPLRTAKGPVKFLTTVNMNFTLRAPHKELLPVQAEKDFARQVKPPEVLNRVVDPGCTSFVHMRVLVNDLGQAIDTQPLKGRPSLFEDARRTVGHWTFGPARWGTMHLPWYVEVDVPVNDPTVRAAAGGPSGP